MKAVAAFLLVLCYLAGSHAWNCKVGPRLYNIKQIDAGQGQVVATDKYNRAYYLIRTYWYSMSSGYIKHASVGPAGIWGTDTKNKVYKYIGGNFTLVNGLSMEQVDAGGDGQVVGVTPSTYRAYCLRDSYSLAYKGTGSVSWNYHSRILKYYTCGPKYGCWGVDSSSRVYHTPRVTPSSCSYSSWRYVSGLSMKMIEVASDGSVFGVATNGRVYQRTGIYSSRTYGLSWSSVSMCMPISHVTYDLGNLWAVTTSGLLLQCSQ
ncbi:fish-egg lectin [Lates calcarifer]|uniref:Fish-egg lectin n=1 Tax=Lates calcarifer TaxID=8187 RepID=A0A4W6E314_LATCA|nr:fish-egg lectin isoform X1 [Lates calcarifer]XP_018559503.1 fish-egg lectin [Lates calcarifer]